MVDIMPSVREQNQRLADAGHVIRWNGYLIPKPLADALGIPTSEQMPAGYIRMDDAWVGFMAQDVLKVKPWAVTRDAYGYLMVDYSKAVK